MRPGRRPCVCDLRVRSGLLAFSHTCPRLLQCQEDVRSDSCGEDAIAVSVLDFLMSRLTRRACPRLRPVFPPPRWRNRAHAFIEGQLR